VSLVNASWYFKSIVPSSSKASGSKKEFLKLS
jgi:hypothetical protein